MPSLTGWQLRKVYMQKQMIPMALAKEDKVLPIREQPFVMPSSDENETREVYIIALKEDAPFENWHLGNITFCKSVLPTDAAIVGNEGKVYYPRQLKILLTKKQADALLAECAKRVIYIPRIKNPEYENSTGTDGVPQTIEGGYYKISDWIILEPEATYERPVNMQGYSLPKDPLPTTDDNKGSIIEQQRQGQNPKGKK